MTRVYVILDNLSLHLEGPFFTVVSKKLERVDGTCSSKSLIIYAYNKSLPFGQKNQSRSGGKTKITFLVRVSELNT